MRYRLPGRDARTRASVRQSGVSMVEFALVSPIFFLVAIGLLVTGVVVTHQVQLTNETRDAARALAVCGSAVSASPGTNVTPNLTLPDHSQCTSGNETAYVTGRIHQVNPSATVTAVDVVTIDASGNVTVLGTGDTSQCASPQTTAAQNALPRFVRVRAQYNQPLFLPLVGKVLGTNGGSTRALTATAVAQCEQ